ncbi:MAG: hypothetical protein KC582_02765 [Candidatus Magasanikbacteria bacterium]|nr:hypothetical protein [Candidatus Magasanikbacteria bacterium]
MTMLSRFDAATIHFAQKNGEAMARIALFIIYFWFGSLKVFGLSPANPLVRELLEVTLPMIAPETFIFFFGVLEALIGILFLFKNEWISRVTIAIMWLHMSLTLLPLFILPQIAWSAPFVPTLEGQYIIKNVALIALTIQLAAHMHKKKFL